MEAASGEEFAPEDAAGLNGARIAIISHNMRFIYIQESTAIGGINSLFDVRRFAARVR
jgi:hypothetical protein